MARTTTPPTFEQRFDAAVAGAEAATSVFDNVIADLESAAVEKKALVVDIETEIDRLRERITYLTELSVNAEFNAEQMLDQAQSIRALVGN